MDLGLDCYNFVFSGFDIYSRADPGVLFLAFVPSILARAESRPVAGFFVCPAGEPVHGFSGRSKRRWRISG